MYTMGENSDRQLHSGNGGNGVKHAHPIPKKNLINTLNYAHFQDITLTAKFKQKHYSRIELFKVKPGPCFGDSARFSWLEGLRTDERLGQLEFVGIVIPANGLSFLIETERYHSEKDGFTIALPEEAVPLADRVHKRYSCSPVSALLIQNGACFSGTIVEMSSSALVLTLEAEYPYSFSWLNSDISVMVTIQKDRLVYFSGECRILRWEEDDTRRSIVVSPMLNHIRRFKEKQFRSSRFELPYPVRIRFSHPLIGKEMELDAPEISGSGFSIREKAGEEALFPGLLLHNCTLVLPGSTELACTAQVIHREKTRPEECVSGCALLDMSPQNLTILLRFLHQHDDPDSFIDCTVEMDDLWKFFFDSGFIYPEKYASLIERKEEIKHTYENLYRKNPGIGKYFVNKKDGVIKGHMAMVRAYENTWLIHHHAATSRGNSQAGIKVLNQVGHFTNSVHRIRSMRMDYLMCYFRPDNKFPVKVFKGIADKIGDPRSCSVDSFAYLHWNCGSSEIGDIALFPGGWVLGPAAADDLFDFESVYRTISGGLLPAAFHMRSVFSSSTTLFRDYEKAQLSRKIDIFALKQDDVLHALVWADFSDPGLNMSELMNCLKIFILDSSQLTGTIINAVVHALSERWPEKKVPVLVFPSSFMDDNSIVYEKNYLLWILKMSESDKYFTHLEKIVRSVRH